MNWDDAEKAIRNTIHVGIDLNTSNSTYRFVHMIEVRISSNAYGYRNEKGFIISIGSSSNAMIKIPWSMLKKCYKEAQSPEGYTGDSFRRLFPRQANTHPCHVHVIGRIFEVAKVAQNIGGVYRAL